MVTSSPDVFNAIFRFGVQQEIDHIFSLLLITLNVPLQISKWYMHPRLGTPDLVGADRFSVPKNLNN